jgi:predicted NACHT family NTPase
LELWKKNKAMRYEKKLISSQSNISSKEKGLHLIRTSEDNKAVIIFVHGLGGHPYKTWTKDKCKSLPMLMMDDESFGRFDLYTFGYKSNFIFKGHNLKDISDLLFTEIKAKVNRKDIYYVTHSMGGVITQSMLSEQVERGNDDFLKANRGVVYLAVPFAGASIASVASIAYGLIPPIVGEHMISVQTRSLKVFSRELHDISVKWVRYNNSQLSHVRQKIIYGKSDKTVSGASAHAPYITDVDTVEENHRSICKVDYDSTVYRLLDQYFNQNMGNSTEASELELEIEDKIIDGQANRHLNRGRLDGEAVYKISPLVYKEIDEYIPRRVVQLENSNSSRWLINNEDFHGLLEVIEENKLVTLLGGAGTGKSIELKFLASVLSQADSRLYPVLICLNKFTPRSLVEILNEYWSDWQKADESRMLIILDGLDEIESKYKKDAIRFIELFVDQHPKINIVVSCRRNFYQSENDQSSGTLQGFKSYVLFDLDQDDIGQYIESALGVASLNFKKVIQENKLNGLMKIPFYLVRMVKMYNNDGKLPKSKHQLFEELLAQGLNNDIEHFRNAVELNNERKILMQTLELLALGMEDLGRNYISEEEFHSLVKNDDERGLLVHCAVWNKREESEGTQWQFEHNNFQEYLAARILARQDISTIKTFLSFPPDHKKISPSWVNTLSFLVNIIDSHDDKFTELLQWLLHNDPEMIVYFETDRIEEKTRIQVFENIFNLYKVKQIWINRDKFDLSLLAQFGQSLSAIEFLIQEINSALHYTTCVNALKLISFMKIPVSKRAELCSVLIEISLAEEKPALVRSTAINALTHLNFHDKFVVDSIVMTLRTSADDFLRSSLYRFLINSNSVDEHIDVFLDGIQYMGIDISDSKSRLLDEKMELEHGLEKVSSSEAVLKTLRFFNDNLDKIDHFFWGDQISVIAISAANVFTSDPSIFSACLEFLKTLMKQYWRKEARDFNSFFDKTGTRLEAIKTLLYQWNKEESDILYALGSLINEEGVDYLIAQYQDGKLTDDDIWELHGVISGEIKLSFNLRINDLSNNKFVLQPIKDYEQERKIQLAIDFNLLFDKEAFLDHIRMIYLREEKSSMTREEIVKARIRVRDNDLKYSDLVINNLHRMAGDSSLSLENAIHRVESTDWDFFSVNEAHRMLKSHDIEISSEISEWIKNWCLKNITNVDFNDALTKDSDNSTRTNNICYHLWFFFRKLNLSFPQNILLDMISYDWIEGHEFLGIEYLEKYLNVDQMAERIWRNLQEGVEHEEVLKNHIDFCKRHGIQDVLPITLELIADDTISRSVRNTSLETYFTLSKDFSTLVSKLIDIKDLFKYEVINNLFNRNYQKECHDHLLKMVREESEEGKLESYKYLIILQDVEGIKGYLNWMKSKVDTKQIINIEISLQPLKIVEAVPYLMEILKLSFQDEFKQDEFNRIDSEIRNALLNIALQSPDNYQHVKGEVGKFISSNQHLKHINFLNVFVEDMESRYYITLQSGRHISEVEKRLEGINV